MSKLQFIGGGNIAKALLAGLLNAKAIKAKNLTVVARRAESRAELEKDFSGVKIVKEPLDEVDAVLAVKPVDVKNALKDLKTRNVGRIMSVVAGVRCSTLEAGLGSFARVVRSMPNTPSQIGFGAAAIAGGVNATEKDLDWAESILSSVGVVVRIEENLMDAVTGLSGSGTGFVLYFAEALQQAGKDVGLDETSTDLLVGHTLLGAAQMILKGEFSAEELRRNVSSPNGTTEAGIKILEEEKFTEIVAKAINKATERAAQIASENE